MKRYLILILLASCTVVEESVYEPPVYSVANRQLPPQPIYNPVRWVALPDPMPNRDVSKSPRKVDPIFEFSVTDISSRELCEILATGLHYKGICSNLSSKDKIKINTLGTMDEIFEKVSQTTKYKFIRDDVKKELRISK